MAWSRKAWAEAVAKLTPEERQMLLEKYRRDTKILGPAAWRRLR